MSHLKIPVLLEKTKVRSTNAQLRCLIDYMTANPDLDSDRQRFSSISSPHAAKQLNTKWEKLGEILTQYGPEKSVEQWKHTWRDLKRKARQVYRQAQNGGNVVSLSECISHQSQNVMEAMHNAEIYNPDDVEIWKKNKLWINTDSDDSSSNIVKIKEDPQFEEVEYLENEYEQQQEEDSQEFDEGHQEQEEGNVDDDNDHDQITLPQNNQIKLVKATAIPSNPPPLLKRPYSNYPPGSPPPPPPQESLVPKVRKTYNHVDVLNTLNKFIDYEKEKVRLAHEREMTRIEQTNRMLSVLEKVTDVIEDLAPSIINCLENDGKSNQTKSNQIKYFYSM